MNPGDLLNADPDPAVFLMRIRIQLKQICKNDEFSEVEKDKKDCSKVKNHKLFQIYLIFKNKITFSTGTSQFFSIFSVFSSKFSLLDPDLCGSEFTALLLFSFPNLLIDSF